MNNKEFIFKAFEHMIDNYSQTIEYKYILDGKEISSSELVKQFNENLKTIQTLKTDIEKSKSDIEMLKSDIAKSKIDYAKLNEINTSNLDKINQLEIDNQNYRIQVNDLELNNYCIRNIENYKILSNNERSTLINENSKLADQVKVLNSKIKDFEDGVRFNHNYNIKLQTQNSEYLELISVLKESNSKVYKQMTSQEEEIKKLKALIKSEEHINYKKLYETVRSYNDEQKKIIEQLEVFIDKNIKT